VVIAGTLTTHAATPLPQVPGGHSRSVARGTAAELLPVEYFHVVLPCLTRSALWPYKINARSTGCSSKRRRELTDNCGRPRHLGAQIGFLSVLHTWGQNLTCIPTSIVSFPAAGCHRTRASGSLADPASSTGACAHRGCKVHFLLERLRGREPTKDDGAGWRRVHSPLLLHVVPSGFMRIRHFGFLAHGHALRSWSCVAGF